MNIATILLWSNYHGAGFGLEDSFLPLSIYEQTRFAAFLTQYSINITMFITPEHENTLCLSFQFLLKMRLVCG